LACSRQGFGSLAALVFLTTVVAPLLQIVTLLYVLIPLRRRRRAPGQNAVLRVLTRVRPWNFLEVFMLGALVCVGAAVELRAHRGGDCPLVVCPAHALHVCARRRHLP